MKESNVSNLTKALAVVSLLAPVNGRPLSIGDIELHSALNQNLNAEIRLHVDPSEKASDVVVRMAPPENFDKAGIPWNYFLSRIKFETIAQGDTLIVKLTSKETLTEPFLDFLLEVNWPEGKQYREFTLLVDPPAGYGQPVIPVAEQSGFRVEPLETPIRQARRSRTTVSANATVHAKQAEPANAINPQTPSSGEYGPTQAPATLWSIAEKLGGERGVPTRLMMNALYKANPDAFNRNNMDSLKAGVTLKIPDTEAILKSSSAPAQARNQQKTAHAESAKGKPLELLAPAEAKISENAIVGGQAKSGQNSATVQGAAGDSGKAADGKDLELQARIEKLEQQLGMMQQLLALKDQQLAAMQNAGKPAPAIQPPMPAAEKPADATAKPVAPVAPPATVQPAAEKPLVQPETPVAPTVQAPPPVPVPPPVAPPKPQAPQVQPAPVPPESDNTYYLTVGGLGAGILSILGWLLWRKRKIEEQINNESMFASASQIKMPDSESSLSVPVMDLDSSAAYDVGTVGESSFISDFTPSDFDAFDTDQNEVDPLSEADVYLAYGRYQQAEELIRAALEQEPGKDAFKLKLLEIFYAGENKQGFADYAQELADDGKQNDRAFWNKVGEMAKEIVPDLPIFGGSGEGAPQKKPAEDLFDTKFMEPEPEASFEELDFPPIERESGNEDLTALMEAAVPDEAGSEFPEVKLDYPATEPADDNSLDFDTSTFEAGVVEKQAETPASDEIETIDFDLSSFSFDDEPEKSDKAESSTDSLESFDFNFDVEKPETDTKDESQIESVAELILEEPLVLDEPLGSKEEFFSSYANVKAPESEVSGTHEGAKEETVGEFEFNFDFDTPIISNKDGEEFGLGVSDLTDMDEYETKIDLAKAYVDMGDAEAAASIAEEVLRNGSKEQQAAALAILEGLK